MMKPEGCRDTRSLQGSRSWIWSSNPRVPDAADSGPGEDVVSDEDVNEVLRVEWTTSFARLARWAKEVELLQEEMQRVVMFLEWKSMEWLEKVDVRGGNLAFDIRSGLDAYARKQAAVYHNLAVLFAELWHPTLASYGLECSWITAYMKKHNVPFESTKRPVPRGRGVFKFRTSGDSIGTISPVKPASSESRITDVATDDHPLLEEATYSDDSDLGDSDDSESDWDDDLEF